MSSQLSPAVGGYRLSFEDYGVFLERDYDNPVTPALVLFHVQRKQIQEVNLRDLTRSVRDGEQRIRVAPNQDEVPVGEDVFVNVSPDETVATMTLLPPDAEQARLNPDDLVRRVRDTGNIQYGLKDTVILDAWHRKRYGEIIVIAEALAPQHGIDGELKLFFRTETTGAARVLEDGRVDFRNLDLFETVEAGQVLAERIPATPAVDGMNVRGIALKGREGREAQLPKGRNVEVSSDGLKLLATKSGRIDYTNRRITISDCLNITKNVDMSVGNLDFNGDIVIYGNVIGGMTVKAKGNIEVRGIVEGATLIAGKNIVLNQGIQGGDRGELRAGGNITAKFIERSSIYAQGNVLADVIIHTRVQCEKDLIVTGKRGSIIGGSACASGLIIARVIGSNSNITTTLEVGILPPQRERLSLLKIQIKNQAEELRKLDMLYRTLTARKETLNASGQERLQKVLRARLQLMQTITDIKSEVEQLTELMDGVSDGKVHVMERIYPGARVVIGTAVYNVDSLLEFATFKNREGEVVFGACEYVPS